MTTLDATALARVLAEHRLDGVLCKCGWTAPSVTIRRSRHEAHVAEVLAALVAASETQARADELRAAADEMVRGHDVTCDMGEDCAYHDAANWLRDRAAALSSTDQQGGK